MVRYLRRALLLQSLVGAMRTPLGGHSGHSGLPPLQSLVGAMRT